MYKILVQRAERHMNAPTSPELRRWVKTTLATQISSAELTIRLVGKDEMTELNFKFRQKNYPTNVLSFPFDQEDDEFELDIPLLGDIVVCADVVNQEALDQHKTTDAHWAHMMVHGTLHLLGFDHVTDSDAEIMETKEIQILKSLGFDNPYSTQKVHHNE